MISPGLVRILITGSGSFIGRNFIKYSAYRYADEVSLINNKPSDIDFKNYDVIIHLAAYVHQKKNLVDDEYFRINRDLCLDVAKFAKQQGVKHFVFLSTAKVYGEGGIDNPVWNEESSCNPQDAYGKSKLAAEIGLQEMEDTDFKVSIIRTPIVYGEGVKANMLNIIRLVDRSFILPFKGINNKRSFTYVENMVGFIDRIIDRRASGIFIVMDKDPLSTTELVELISKSMNKKIISVRLPLLFVKSMKKLVPGLHKRLFSSLELNNKKTLIALDYNPPFSSAEGLKKTVDWYRTLKNK